MGGECYKMCAVLTNGEYPYRSGADSCCSKNEYVECLDPENYVSDPTFDVGGGDEELGEEMMHVHPPIPELAEEQTLPAAPVSFECMLGSQIGMRVGLRPRRPIAAVCK